MAIPKSTERFSDRVENYVRSRPGYPDEVLTLLEREYGLGRERVVADVASGTGLFTRMLLHHGNVVFAVEPNAEMRRACEKLLGGEAGFTSVAGTAEATTLPDRSVDFVTAAQAAHWFDRRLARREFARILKPGGWAVLLWNERRIDSTAFLKAYEDLLMNYGTDYQEVRHERTTAVIGEFFAPAPFREHTFEMKQEFDYPGLEGRLLSSSYTPPPGHPKHEPMLEELRRIFALHQREGKVELEYNTRVYVGQLI